MSDTFEQEKFDNESSGIDFRQIWSIFLLNWYWFIISALVCFGLAMLYLRYQPNVYRVATKVLIKEEENKRYSSNDLMQSQMGFITNSSGFDNEIEILSSAAVATRAVKSLKLYVRYTMEGRVRDADLYRNSPIVVDIEESHLDELKQPLPIAITKKGKGIYVEISQPSKGDAPEVLAVDLKTLPSSVNANVGKILFSQNPGFELGDRKLTAVIYPPIAIGRRYSRSLRAEPTTKFTSVARLSLLDTHPERAMDYLAELVEAYNEDANEDKNLLAEKTEDFINDRINSIRTDLDATESQIEQYKRGNSLVNLPTDATTALTQSTEFQKKQVEIQTQMSLVKSLLDYVENPTNSLTLIPANIGVSNPATNSMIAEYNNGVIKRNRLIRGSSENNPQVLQVTDEVMSMWSAVQQQLRGIYSDLQIQRNSAESQYNRFSGRVSSTPTQERAMNNMGRQQELKASLYLMLLEKREQNAISMKSIATKARVIDMPLLEGKVSPKSRLILLASLIIGFLLPFLYYYLKDLLRFHIEGRDDLEKASKLSILADIPLTSKLSDGERAIVVKENTNDMMEEAFRGLRTNLRFVLEGNEKVILTTSSVPGEGKTFVATNLAMSLALLDKHVLVVGLDIRKPRLVKLFNLPQREQGITNYLSAETADFDLLEKQIVHGVINKNLDVLPAGIIPPNPGELITREMLDKAFEHLRTIYDYIILDTPPVGLVSDTLELGRLADVSFFVVRPEVTTKNDVDNINRIAETKKLPKVNLVLNGIDLKKKKYGFYYGYGKYSYSRYGTYYGRYGHYGSYGHYGDRTQHIEK
ncbi:MAG: polysaccharide biosynthesis tyrosine autokinase [Bacteroidaceae bacterium]|nr:polysaccharide biosynthesis tyrosine autokinase [Bacteroidaceae bacterium]